MENIYYFGLLVSFLCFVTQNVKAQNLNDLKPIDTFEEFKQSVQDSTFIAFSINLKFSNLNQIDFFNQNLEKFNNLKSLNLVFNKDSLPCEIILTSKILNHAKLNKVKLDEKGDGLLVIGFQTDTISTKGLLKELDIKTNIIPKDFHRWIKNNANIEILAYRFYGLNDVIIPIADLR